MKILLAEMSNQDPMNPVGNQEFLSQMAQLQTLEATSALTESIETLVALQRLSSAGALIGKQARGTGGNGQEVTGTVEKINVNGSDISVTIDGTEIGLDRIQELWQDA